jgi:hypothetical protein
VSCQRLSRWSSPTSSLGFAYRCTRHACWVIRIQLDNRSDIGKEQWSIHDLCEAIRELPRNLDMARFDEMMRGSYDIVALNCRHERGGNVNEEDGRISRARRDTWERERQRARASRMSGGRTVRQRERGRTTRRREVQRGMEGNGS